MKVIDSQIHPHAADSPKHPWKAAPAYHGPPEAPAEAPAELQLRMMDEMGVDRAVMVSSSVIYGTNPGYALECAAKYPDRFGVVYLPDPTRPDIREHVQEWAALPTTVGLRIWLGDQGDADAVPEGRFDTFFQAAQDCSQPICFAAGQRFAAMTDIAQRFPGLQIVLDHLGLYPPVWPTPDRPAPTPAELLSHLPGVLELGRRFPNVAIKVSRVPTLSTQAYPFRDIWDPVRQVVEAFGPERCMWGTDWTTVTHRATYPQAVDYIRQIDGLTVGDLEWIMGGAAARIFNGAPAWR